MGNLISFNPAGVLGHSQGLSNASQKHMGGVNRASGQGRDVVEFGGKGLSKAESMQVVYDRAMEKLRSVVGAARAELGFSEDAVVDTSPEATAARIVEFALGNFDRFQENHPELGEGEARAQFAEFIGGAINEGIEEASGILSALSAMNPDVESMIDTISGIVQERLAAFAQG